ncbi:hypothetical protein [uncultured Chryseobacterium sp.]|uniref:hypothetical protein n=1 Tax=uncultured Chryseobacterium sp. TaxID=259322 RepID=UPI0025D90B1A|nr:hypothetical protein [uncultured Chryseobacterium sp.]
MSKLAAPILALAFNSILLLEVLEMMIVALSASTSSVITTQFLSHFPSLKREIISFPSCTVSFIEGVTVLFALNKVEFSLLNSTIIPASISVRTLPCGATVPDNLVVIVTLP